MHWLQGVHSSLSSYTLSHNVDIKFIDIPATTGPSQTLLENTCPEATVFRLNNSTAFIHARLTDANTVLELRHLTWLEKNDNPFSSPRNMRLQIRVSATLLPVIRFTQDSETLWCYVLSANNYFVRIRIPVKTMFLTPLPGKFYSIQQLDQHIMPVTFDVVSSAQAIIACENGSLIYLYDSYNGQREKNPFSSHEIVQQDANPQKNALAYLASLPLLSSIFTEDQVKQDQRSKQPVALAVEPVPTNTNPSSLVAAAICRDRRLRVWLTSHDHTRSQASTDLPWFDQHNKLVETGVDLTRDALPGSIVETASVFAHTQRNDEPDLDCEPRKILRLFRICEDRFLAATFVESEQKSFFAFYHIALQDGDIRSVKLVHVVECNIERKEWLSGFDMTMEGNDATLWTVWHRQPLAIVRTATLYKIFSDDNDSSSHNSIPIKVRWRTILPDCIASRLSSRNFDSKDAPQMFLKHIFTPGAFSDSDIRKALMAYVETVDAHERTLAQDDFLTNNEDRDMHEVTSIGNSSDDDRPTLKKYTRDLVASHIVKDDDETDYQSAVNEEWEKFYHLCCDFEDLESIPLMIIAPQKFEGNTISNPVLVARHDGYSTVRRLDELELLHHHYAPGKDDLQQQCFIPMELENNDVETELQTKTLVTKGKYNPNIIRFVTSMASLISLVGEQTMAEIDLWLEQALLRETSAPNADATGHHLYKNYILKADICESDEKLSITKLRECGDLDATIQTILDALVDPRVGEVSGDKSSVVLDSLITNAAMQLVQTRYCLARNIIVVLAFLVALDGNQKIMKNTLDRLEDCQNILKAYTLLQWMCKKSLDEEVATHFGIEAKVAESSHQAYVPTADDSPTSGLMQLLVSRNYPIYVHHEPFEATVTRSARQLLQQLEFLQSDGKFSEASVISVANCIESLGQPNIALSILQCLPVSDAILFVQAKCWTRLEKTKDAENAFLRVANGFDDFYEHQPQSSVGEALQQLLPQGCDTLIDYYIHVSAFVFAHSQADLIIKFGKLALTSIEAVHESKKAKESGHKQYVGSTSSLWYRVFVGYLLKKDVEGATSAMTSIEELERRADAARYLVSWLAENDNLGVLCTLPLSGLRPQVENALVSKAEEQDVPVPESQVNFSKHLYAFYVYAGDYGPAALSMYKMARRCQQNLKAPEALKQSVTSYLAAINSLSMLPSDKQWLSVPVKNSQDDKTDLIDIARLRKEYITTKAHLDLMDHYPEVANSNTVIDVKDAIEKFEKLGLQDRAQLLKCNQ